MCWLAREFLSLNIILLCWNNMTGSSGCLHVGCAALMHAGDLLLEMLSQKQQGFGPLFMNTVSSMGEHASQAI